MDWLLSRATPDLLGGNVASIATMLPVLSAYGQRETLSQLLQYLVSQQKADGSFCDTSSRPCPIVTGQVLRALLPLEHPAAAKASHWLTECQSQDTTPPGSLITWSSPALRLIPLAALARSGQVLSEPHWTQWAHQAARDLKRQHDLTQWDMPTHWFGQIVRAMLDLDWQADAKHALQLPAALQRRSGEVPALPDVDWVSSSGLAELTICWQQLGEHDRANAAIAALRGHQLADGSFVGSWGRGAAYHPQRAMIATTCRFLEASLGQVSATFARGTEVLDNTIDPTDGRLLAVRDFLLDLPPGSRIADVGCGAGRYLGWLRQWFPQYDWTGIDAAESALDQLPASVECITGSLLNLPVNDGRFDAVYCVEALEHSLYPRQAVAELCRIVRPGGRLLIIDKHRSFQGISHHEPWETWFTPDELANSLRPNCHQVTCRPIPHGPHVSPTGLFLCWTAEVHQAAHRRAA